MPVERFFVDSPLKKGNNLALEGTELHHLAHVMRLKAGDSVELVNGCGELAEAQLVSLNKRQAQLTVLAVKKVPPAVPEIILAQAIPRINRLDFIIEKGTELGMTQIWLFPGRLSERKELTAHQMERLRAVAIAAMKQCGRLYLPEIVLKPPLQQWKELSQRVFFGDVDPAAQLFKLGRDEVTQGVLFFVGPESGFTEEEIGQLKKLHAQGVSLHPHILRTDTAALCALSLISDRLRSFTT
jgi:16S rRNA (uracil1498-N3)-methyltransferase